MRLCMNILDLTWEGTSKCFLSSSLFFTDILCFLGTFPPCVFSQIFLTSTSREEVE